MKSRVTGAAIGLVALIVGLTILDRFLAKLESAELHGTAQRSYTKGMDLLKDGRTAEAIEQFRNSHMVERENNEYELALIGALIANGKSGDASALMDDVLGREPNSGQANLLAARLMVQQGRFADGESYYHRAIYGEWPQDAAARRQDARMELIGLMSRRGEKQELLAELILLEAEAGPDPELHKKIAQMFLSVDSPARAAAIYEALVTNNHGDAEAYEGLGEAELERGQYGAARSAFSQASLKGSNDPSIRSSLETLNMVVALDPTGRQLTSEEKYRRSRGILELTERSVRECGAGGTRGTSREADRLLTDADATLSSKSPAHMTNEMAEGVLEMAEALWRARGEKCGVAGPQDRALSLIMKKIAA